MALGSEAITSSATAFILAKFLSPMIPSVFFKPGTLSLNPRMPSHMMKPMMLMSAVARLMTKKHRHRHIVVVIIITTIIIIA